MSFKGRVIGKRLETGAFEGVVAFDGKLSVVYYVKDVAIRQGLKIEVLHNYESTGYDYNYRIYIVNSSGTPIRFIGDYSTPLITHTIEDADAAGIAFVSNDNPSGNYSITWLLTVWDNTLIDNPVEAIRNIKLLQNWSELDLMGASYNWGKDIVSDVLIKNSGEGSFNSSTLDEIKALKIARQFFDETYTADAIESILKEFCLTSYQDNNGYECLKSILTKENPSEVITFADIKGEVGDMIEPQLSDIYCTPVFNYAFDYATEKYTKQIRVEKVWETTYDASYTPGLNGTDGATIWALCRALWLKTRQVEPMPQDMSNHEWVPDYDTAVWCLKQQIKMMSIKRCNFNVGYMLGRKWNIGKHFMLQLPHETNNNQVECVIERITKKKNDNTVSVQIMILDEISFFFES
jgi:hypothetical protein